MELATTHRQRSLDEWLDATKDDDQYDRFLAACLDGTCEWILSHPSYLAWEKRDEKNEIAKLLWIHGPAGFGKTILSASLIRHIRKILHLPLVYCFSSSHAQAADGLEGVVRTWLTQLVRMDNGALDIAYQLLQERNTRKASKEDLWNLLGKSVKQLQKCVLVLDGLDEFQSIDDQRRIFLSRLKISVQSTGTAILITSRSEFDINLELRPSFPEVGRYRILECKISEDIVKNDIHTFASSIVERRLPRQANSLRKELSARMAERCQGQFLWLKLQQSQLRDSKSPKILRKSIEIMPQGLHSTYEHSWNNVQALEEPDRSRAIDTLRWLTFAFQPLTVQVLAEAMVINLEADSEGFSEDDLPDEIDEEYIDGEIKQLCGSLVEVHSHEHPRFRVVRLVHASVHEFLAAKLPASPFLGLGSEETTSSAAQHAILAAHCIRLLESGKVSETSDLQKEPLFAIYAVEHWYRHLRRSDVYYDHVSDYVDGFVKPGNPNFETWKMRYEGSALPSGLAATSFYYVAYFGLAPAMIYLHEYEHVDIDSVGGQFGTALQAVCTKGYGEAFDCLIQWHADPKIRGGHFGSALNAAAYCGNTDMVERLLDIGVSASPLKLELHEAMRLAASGGSLEIVRLFIDRGAPVDPPEALYPIHRYSMVLEHESTPLLAAAGTSQVKVLRLLLERGANPNLSSLPDIAGWNALHLAATVNSHEAVELLLLHGADVNSQMTVGTPLHMASAFGSIDVVKALLDNGAAMDAYDEEQCTPLHDAARYKTIDALAYLLRGCANPKAQNKDLKTPLHVACRYGGIEVVKALLDNGAAIDAYDKWKETPLHDAARAGSIDVFALLLYKGANPNLRGKYLRTPLHIASRNGSIDVVKALLESGATIDANKEGQVTPLHLAAANGRIDVLLFLLHKGANPNAQDDEGWTPLCRAAANGETKAIATLLEQQANVNINAQINEGMTALGIAIGSHDTEIARLLIDRGADMNIPSVDGATALRSAIESSDDGFVCDLIRLGADLGVMDQYGMTCSDWLQRSRPHLMIPEVEGYEPDKISSGPDTSVLRHHLLDHAKDMRSDEPCTSIWLYFLARCFLLLDIEDHAIRAYNFMSSNVICDSCDMDLAGKDPFFACKFCPNTDFCEPCMEGHSEVFRRKSCLSHKFLKIMPLEASNRADDDDEAFRQWLDEIIEQFRD